MKERPIIFSATMVQALLLGRKTQTRRLIKDQPFVTTASDASWRDARADLWRNSEQYARDCCPYGVTGDRLWVREAWGYRGSMWNNQEPKIVHHYIQYRADNIELKFTRDVKDGKAFSGDGLPEQNCKCKPQSKERDEFDGVTWDHGNELSRYWKSYRSPLFMPRWASRITLELTDVRVQRLKDISADDAYAEGVGSVFAPGIVNPVPLYAMLWDEINEKRVSWDSNPWVWKLAFKRIPNE